MGNARTSEQDGAVPVDGVVGAGVKGVSGGGAEGMPPIVALSSARNDSAATGARSR